MTSLQLLLNDNIVQQFMFDEYYVVLCGTYRSTSTNECDHNNKYKFNYLVLDPLGGLARHILPPLSPSQPVIAKKKFSCWGFRLNYIVLDHLGGLTRHILPPLSPSEPVIAERKISCWG